MTAAGRRAALRAALFLTLAALASSRPALAANATLTSLGAGLYNTVAGKIGSGPVKTYYFAGALRIRIDGGPETESYCVDISNGITFGDTEPQVPPDYPCEVVYILSNAFPHPSGIPTALGDTNREAAAVQTAIWHFTDAFTVTAPADVVSRRAQIVTAAQSQCGAVPPVPQAVAVTPPTAINYTPAQTVHTATATLTDTHNQALTNHPIQLTVTGAAGPASASGTTDALGQFSITYPNTFVVTGSDTITAKVSFLAPVGLKFKKPGKQGIVLAGTPQTGMVTGQGSKSWVPAVCGDGIVNQAGELCDDGNGVSGDGCDSNCTETACGNGVVTTGEVCDDGNLISGDGCDFGCKPTGCGSGVKTGTEECDDGNAVDGDGCDHNCTISRCGNVVVVPPEQCDDGNPIDGDGCDSNCTPTACGNGVVTGSEECDDGNLTSGDGCDANCSSTRCGNGIQTAGEECDDHDVTSGDGCDANCTTTRCGNGIVTAPEQCDDGNGTNGDGCDNNCTATLCGNGIQTAGEQCDDGNLVSGDGCDSNCTPTACGNGVQAGAEACDDGNPSDGDGCDSNCTATGCGNGVRTGPESCDDGNLADGDGCDANCTPTGCGNGITTGVEECDDGNAVDSDGCEADCTTPRCGNQIVDPPETCDDGNAIDGDGCDAGCHVQEICADLLDNDGDMLIDCEDPDCGACDPIVRDPAIIQFIKDRYVFPDMLKVHGGVTPRTPVCLAGSCAPAERLGVLLTNANGVIFRGFLAPGDLKGDLLVHRLKAAFRDPAASLGHGTRDGLAKVTIELRRGRYRIGVRAYGNLRAATVPTMTVQFLVGNDIFFNKGLWTKLKNGWRLDFPSDR